MNKKIIIALILGIGFNSTEVYGLDINHKLKNNIEFEKILKENELNSFDDGDLFGEIKKSKTIDIKPEEKVRLNSNLTIIEKNLIWADTLNLNNKPEKIVLHHIDASRKNDTIKVEEVHQWHLENKWAGIGYHFYINKNGEVYRGRPEAAIGAHAKNNNINTIGIAVEGDYENEIMSKQQKKSVELLGEYLRNKYKIEDVLKHKDVTSTSCPGANYPFESIKSNILKNEVSKEKNYKWKIINGNTYYRDIATGENVTGKRYIGESTYYFNEEGVMQIGWQMINGQQYYFDTNGYMLSGLIYLGENTYYFNEKGVMQIGWQMINGQQYYFDTNGYMLSGLVYLGESTYYFNEKGVMQTGWQMINGQQYYFDTNGYMLSGLRYLGESTYYFNEKGVMQIGWQVINGQQYYFDINGYMLKGLIYLGESTYYFNEKGVMQIGWQVINGQQYYFYENGYMARNTIIDGIIIGENGVVK